jgi:hypothetical protein
MKDDDHAAGSLRESVLQAEIASLDLKIAGQGQVSSYRLAHFLVISAIASSG